MKVFFFLGFISISVYIVFIITIKSVYILSLCDYYVM